MVSKVAPKGVGASLAVCFTWIPTGAFAVGLRILAAEKKTVVKAVLAGQQHVVQAPFTATVLVVRLPPLRFVPNFSVRLKRWMQFTASSKWRLQKKYFVRMLITL